MCDSVDSGYERYLQHFQEKLESDGYRPSKNKLRDRLLGIPEPMTREQWLEDRLALIMPIAEVGFERKKQVSAWGKKGWQTRKRDSDETRQAVAAALDEIRLHWKSTNIPSGRKLSEMVSKKTGISQDTVRKHIISGSWLLK